MARRIATVSLLIIGGWLLPAEVAQGKPPRVVDVNPKDGAVEIDPVTEIRIRFDQPMASWATALHWKSGFFTPTGSWRYLPKTHEFVIPVSLKPYEEQRIVLNDPAATMPGQGFRSAAGELAKPFEWHFRTRRDFDDEEVPLPQLVAVDPPDGAVVGMVVPVRITFDQPMEPDHFHAVVREEESTERLGQTYFHVRYVEERNEFVIPVALPPGWSGTLVFEGFRSKSRRHAEAIRVTYATSKVALSEEHRQQILVAERSLQLEDLLRQVGKARGKVKSLVETIRVTRYALDQTGIFASMQSTQATFSMDGRARFRGEVSAMMNSPFVVGSDGRTCWWYSKADAGPQVVSCPADKMNAKNVLICDPFHSTRTEAHVAIEKLNLEYLGSDTLDGRPCEVVQGWSARVNQGNLVAHVDRWWIDSRTYLPVQVVREWGTSTRVVQRFTIEKLNQPMPLADFRPPAAKGTKDVPLEPLTDDYDSRFLDVIDAGNGQISVRWGRIGPAGVSANGVR